MKTPPSTAHAPRLAARCMKGAGRIGVERLVKQITISERGEPENPCRILIEGRWQDGQALPRRNKNPMNCRAVTKSDGVLPRDSYWEQSVALAFQSVNEQM